MDRHAARAGDPDHGLVDQPCWRRASRCARSEAEAELTVALLEIVDLSVEFATTQGTFRAVENLSLVVDAGEFVAVVGESGSGKSVAMLAIMGLLPWTATVMARRLAFDGHDLLTMSPRARRRIVGKDIAMIF